MPGGLFYEIRRRGDFKMVSLVVAWLAVAHYVTKLFKTFVPFFHILEKFFQVSKMIFIVFSAIFCIKLMEFNFTF